jgi:hypothetical protein
MENNKTPKFAITYGNIIDTSSVDCLHTIFVSSTQKVKKLALKFIKVIPDNIDNYTSDIENWNGEDKLLITHQDDDAFYFSATLIQLTDDFSEFTNFVSANSSEED